MAKVINSWILKAGVTLPAVLIFCLSQTTQAALTNLVTYGTFEGIRSSTSDPTVGSISPSAFGNDYAQYESDVFNAQYSQWSTQTDNDFQIQPQGSRSASATGADGNPTGNYLEILGRSNTGVVTLTIDIPANVVAGANNATLNFESWSQNPGSYQNTGRYQIVVTGSNNTDTGLVTINNLVSDWRANAVAFTVASGDTVNISWSETNNSKGWEGLRIDDVQLLVDIAAVPEPATLGVVLLAAMGLLSGMKRYRNLTASSPKGCA